MQSGRPIVGIAQTGSDLSPCNRHHLVLATRVREGIRDAGGIPIEFPVHPIQETGKRPTAGLDRNLAYLGLVEILYGYPIDGVVLTIGCDKTTPACLMAAATVDIPRIALSVGPMISAWADGKTHRLGHRGVESARDASRRVKSTARHFIKLVASAAPSTGYCNTMGTATTMNSLTEVLGMSLPGSAAIPAPHRDRQECAYETGRQIVEMIHARPQAVRHPHARILHQRHPREFRARRLDQCSVAPDRTGAPHRCGAFDRRLADIRLRGAAAGEPATRRRVSRRGLLPRRRRAGGRRTVDEAGSAIR